MNTPTPTLDELEAQNLLFEHETPLAILKWTFDRYGDDLAMACSFEDLSLIHI